MAERSPNPLVELVRSRLLEFLREPAAVFWTFGFPVLLAVGLGVAFRHRPPEPIRAAVVEGGEASTRLVEILEGAAEVEPMSMSAGEADEALRVGRVAIAVRAEALAEEPLLSYRYDATRPEGRLARLAVDGAIQRGLGRTDVARVEEARVTETGSRYIDFLIPGLIGLNVLSSSIWGIGYAVVLARRRRLLRRLAVTPMRRAHYLLAFMVSRLVFLVTEVVALMLFGWLVFDVAIRGSVAWLAVLVVAGGFAFMGLALCIAARPDSTEVASGWMNAVSLPMWLLSGSFFSYERFPEAFHPVIRLLPLTAFNDALRATINMGASPLETVDELAVLLAWGGFTFVLALKLFRWQ